MKRTICIVASILLAAALVYLFFSHLDRHPDDLLPKEQPAESAGASVMTPHQQAQMPSTPTPAVAQRVQTTTASDPQDVLRRQELVRQAIESKNVPVEFHAKVIDQNSNALSGVKISTRVRHWNPSSMGESIPVQTETDSNGQFNVQGVTGDGVDIESITKSGYELEPTVRTYDAKAGSYTDPVLFKMWSTNVHERLISGQKSFHITPDGRAYTIDLTKGTIAESGEGDLKVWVKRPDSITPGQKYDWSCGIDVPNGGLQQTGPGDPMYQAPVEAYIPSFGFEQKIGSGWGDFTGTKQFYIALNGGKEYGRISVELYAYYNKQIPGMIRIEYALNPSGSRILR